jgi:hypothetical protein
LKPVRIVSLAALFAITFGSGMLFQKLTVPLLKKTSYIVAQEPLLLEVHEAGAQQRDFHMLPTATPMYYERAFPEGHTTYRVYVNIKGDFASKEIVSDKSNLIDPIWAYPVAPEELAKLVGDTPLSKDDLVRILKARKMTREDLAQIVREWRD